MSDTPDWVMTGFTTPDGRVAIVASLDIADAIFESTVEYDDDLWPYMAIPKTPKRTTTLNVEIPTCTVVTGDDYQDALANLFKAWQPKRRERGAIDARRSIET